MFAADSDIAFATISEEWGLIVAVMMVLCVAAYGFFAIRTARVARSSFYSIGSCTAASILVIQTILNCLGTLDILPFTGVTFPFVSNGGSAMISAWGLLAYLKTMDTREDASFDIGRMPQRKLKEETARRAAAAARYWRRSQPLTGIPAGRTTHSRSPTVKLKFYYLRSCNHGKISRF